MYTLEDRILGSIICAGMGDGLGAPTEGLSYEQIIERFSKPVDWYMDPKDHRVSFNNHAAEITDDASQMWELLLGVINNNGLINEKIAADSLLNWAHNWPKYYPQQAGPTMREWVKKYEQGCDPVELGKKGETYSIGITNGAVMRVAVAGLRNPGNLDKAIEDAYKLTVISHGTQHAISGACAIACAIAKAVEENSTIDQIIKASIYGAKRGEEIGLEKARHAFGPRVLPQIIKAVQIAYESDNSQIANKEMMDALGLHYDVQPTTAVALGIFIANDGDPIECIKAAANIGGDTDTVGCVVGMIAGAYKGFEFMDKKWTDCFLQANPDLDFKKAAHDLAQIIANE